MLGHFGVRSQYPAPSTGTKSRSRSHLPDGVFAKTTVLKSSFAAIARVVRIYIRNLGFQQYLASLPTGQLTISNHRCCRRCIGASIHNSTNKHRPHFPQTRSADPRKWTECRVGRWRLGKRGTSSRPSTRPEPSSSGGRQKARGPLSE